MANLVQIKRGAFASIPILAAGEFGFSTDAGAQKLHIGDGAANHEVVLHDLFAATSFLYATSDNTPQAKTRAEVMAILSGQAAADFAMNAHKITGVLDPTLAQDAATKAYVDAIATGLDLKESCELATAAALPACTVAGVGVGKTLTMDVGDTLTVDGVLTALDNRVLVKDQVAGEDNGIYKVTTNGANVLVEDAEDAWAETVDPTGVTNTLDTVDYQVGAGSAKCAMLATAVTGILATEAIGSTDISSATTIRMWVKCSVATALGDLQLLLDDTAACASPIETIDIPALVAATWTEVNLTLAAPASDTAIISVGLNMVVDIGACDLWVDDVKAVKQAVLTRATDTDTEVTAGLFTFIEKGTANADEGWVLTTDDPITVDTTALVFSQFSGVVAGANTALSNLAAVALNTALLPDVAAADDFGSALLPFKDLFFAGSSATPATNNFKITGASTTGTRVITFPDETGTVLTNVSNIDGGAFA